MKILVITLFFLTGCGTVGLVEKKMENEVNSTIIQKDVSTEQSTKNLINSSSEISDAKKVKLLDLQKKTKQRSVEINDKLAKTKIFLLETVLKKKMSYQEFNILKKSIRQLEKEKVDVGLNALTQARNIINPLGDNEDINFYRPYLPFHTEQL